MSTIELEVALNALKIPRMPEVEAAIATKGLTSGELASTAVTNGQIFNGAQFITVEGARVGLLFPPDASGASSFIASRVPLRADVLEQYVGVTLRFVVVYDATANFLAETPRSSVSLQVIRGGATVNVPPASIANNQVGTVLTTVLTYVVTAADSAILLVYQAAASAAAQSYERAITLNSLTYSLEALRPNTAGSSDDLLLNAKLLELKDLIPGAGGFTQIKVGPSGAYATPKLAMASIVDASENNQYELLIDTSVKYDQDFNWQVKDYVHMTADGPGLAWIHYENPDDVAPAVIPNTQTFFHNVTSYLTRLKVTGRNLRYPIHSDSAGQIKGRTQRVNQCWIEHLGNAGAQAYQDSIGSGVTVWTSQHAWGCGTSSAMVIEGEGSVFRSPTSAFYVHTRELFAAPSRVKLSHCKMLATNDSADAVAIQPLGSMQQDLLELIGCEIGGDMSYSASPWIPDTLANQPANHSEVRIVGQGNSPFVFKISDFGRALKIESSDTTGASQVEVSGGAVATLFGREVFAFPGAGGIKGYVHGWADISGTGVGLARDVFITSLGRRLGDCRTLNQTLNVKVNGGATIAITFDQDYTAQSNTTILATINTALAGAAVASAYNVGARYRPEMLDEERSLQNNTADGIYMGMVLAYDGHNKKVRKMTASDSSSLFAGVALADIYPGQWGRVKTCGWVRNTDLYEFVGTLAWHQALYVDADVPGRPTLTAGANPIMRGKAADVVEVLPKQR